MQRRRKEKEMESKMKKEEYVIEGMSCASCVNTIENNVSKLKGIKDIKINFVRNIAFVEFDEKIINRVQILSTIKKTGYSAKVVEKYNEKNGKITLLVTGMMSNHCANIVKTSLERLDGIINLKINSSTSKAEIEYNPNKLSINKVISAVNKAGYKAELYNETSVDLEKAVREKEIKSYKIKTIIAFIFSLPLLYITMGPHIGIILPNWININTLLLQLMLATPAVIVGYLFYVNGFKAILNLSPNMDSLIGMGTGVAYLYSIFVSVMVWNGSQYFTHDDLYYEVATFLIFFILLGKYLEAIVKGKTSEAIKKLMGLQAKTAIVIRNKKEIEVPFEELLVGDIIVVKPGQKIPVD